LIENEGFGSLGHFSPTFLLANQKESGRCLTGFIQCGQPDVFVEKPAFDHHKF